MNIETLSEQLESEDETYHTRQRGNMCSHESGETKQPPSVWIVLFIKGT